MSACAPAVSEAVDADRIAFADPDVFPESITSTSDGTLFVSSAGTGNLYRVAPGEDVATVWVPFKESGIEEMLGVYADEPSGTLYACSIGVNALPPQRDELSALYAFDIASGNVKAKYPLPGGAASLCNDIAVSEDGTIYVSDTSGGRILILWRGSDRIDVWLSDDRLATINGIAIGQDGAVHVDTMMSGKLFRIDVLDNGEPAELAELRPSLPLDRPDGLRAAGDGTFLLAEAGGRISHVTVVGSQAELTPIATGNGWSSVARAEGRLWAVNPKAEYKMDPNLADEDPNPFFIEAVDEPEGD